MKHLYLSILFLASISVSAQTTEATNLQNDTTEKAKTSLTLASLYSSNINYYGQVSTQKLPYIVGYAAVSFPVGFWLSGQTYKLLNSGSGISGITLSAGYEFNLTKNLSGSLSYGRSFYPDSSQLLQSANDDMASAALTYDWQWLKTGLSADYATGTENALYTTFNTSKYIDLGISFSSKDYLTLEPAIQVIGGTQRFTTIERTGSNGSNDNENWLDEVIYGKNGKIIPGRKNKLLPGPDKNTETLVTDTSFDLLAYNFILPLAYNRANYALEISYQGAVLSKAVSDSQKLQSFFNLGFYYTF